MSRWLAAIPAVALLAACGDAEPGIQLVLEVPSAGSDAYPYDGIESFVLSVALAGEPGDLESSAFGPGEPLSLAGVPFADDLVIHLSARKAGDEVAYGRTCALQGSAEGPPVVATPHLYLSRVLKWGDTAAPRAPNRTGGFAFALPDGGAAFVGDDSPMERFDPTSTGEFIALEPTLARDGGALATLQGGLAVVVGGVAPGGAPVTAVEVLDPAALAANQVASYDGGPAVRDHRAVELIDGSALVAGGISLAPDDTGLATANAYRFRIGAANALDGVAPLRNGLLAPRAQHSMTRLSDEVGAPVVVIGGVDDTGAPVISVELFRPLRDEFEAVDGVTLQRWGHTAVRLPGGVVLIAGGWEPDPGGGDPVPARRLVVFDPIQATFDEDVGELPAGAAVAGFTTTQLTDGRVLFAGGVTEAGEPVANAYVATLDPDNGDVYMVPTDGLDVPRGHHTAVPLCDGTILVVGGTDTGAPAERYNPSSDGRR